ncbi:MAG: hypothetical protein WBP85_05725 [Terracidiphilus sp.]
MKLRIQGNSVRLRVSRSELERLLRGERVEDAIQFSAAPESRLSYGLQAASQAKPVEVEWKPRGATVLVAQERMKRWGSESEVGIYESVDLGPAGALAVTIEKDFACLDRSHADDSDSFANPKSARK